MRQIALMERVRKTYGPTLALDDVSFELGRGEVLGVLGPNGAGKTTAVALLTGLRAPDSGRVELLGGDPRDPATRERLGTTPQATGFPETLRAAEVVDFVARHYRSPGARSAGSRSRSRSSATPRWSCSTSRLPAWTCRDVEPCGTASPPTSSSAGRSC